MAFIKQLTLQHFRNIDALTLDELSNITLITGDNGAGKSSVLMSFANIMHLNC